MGKSSTRRHSKRKRPGTVTIEAMKSVSGRTDIDGNAILDFIITGDDHVTSDDMIGILRTELEYEPDDAVASKSIEVDVDPKVKALLDACSIFGPVRHAIIDLCNDAKSGLSTNPRLRQLVGDLYNRRAEIYHAVMSNPDHEYTSSVLAAEFNVNRQEIVDLLKKLLPPKFHSMINMGNAYKILTKLFFEMHYNPTTNTKCNGNDPYDKQRPNQCCISTLQTSLPNYLFDEVNGKKKGDERSNRSFIPGIAVGDMDVLSFVKGTQSELNDQADEYATMLELRSRLEFFAVGALNISGHALIHLVQYGTPLKVGVSSSFVSEAVYGLVGLEKYFEERTTDLTDTRWIPHAQVFNMGCLKSKRLYPDDHVLGSVSGIIGSSLVYLYSAVVDIPDGFTTNILTWYGGKYADSNIELGILSHLAAILREKEIDDLTVTDRALYDAQSDLHGPDYLQDLIDRFSAGHEMQSLASQLNADYSVPTELEPEI